MNIRKGNKLYKHILIVILIISSISMLNYSKNKQIEKETKISKNNEIKSLDQEGNTYRLVTSADNVQVPVPKGYVASNITGENYVTPEYSHTTITHKVSSTPTEIQWSSPEGETYPWTQDANGIWISGNQGIPSSTSTLESEEFDYVKGTTLTINYTYSSQIFHDYFRMYLINITDNMTEINVAYKQGNTEDSFDYTSSTETCIINDWATGRYKIKVIYSKDSTIDDGQDSGYIKASTYFKEDENGTETFEEDIKTKIHDGGFVIYQLTDEELETDPNGTDIIINDTNKYEAQSTRNQYVWVPLPNIEDIIKTKTSDDITLQFGQPYIFNSTSITKNTETFFSSNFMEPRFNYYNNSTKRELQRYSNIKQRENYLNNMQEDFTRMIKSINKYKGFYIGRYETGDDYTHSSSKGCFTNPRIVRYNGNISYVTWYDTYIKLQRLSRKTGEYVETGMIYDTLWDYTIIWLNLTDTRSYEEISVDAGTYGNFQKITTTLITGNSYPSYTGAIDTITYKGKTYRDSPTASNNIFDLIGNVDEWSRGLYSTNCRALRGDQCYAEKDAKSVNLLVGSGELHKNFNSGSRAQLYIL